MISNFILSGRESTINDNDDREIQTAIISASKSLTSENVETLIFADQNGGKKADYTSNRSFIENRI